jgi:hypothetical protein
MQVSPKGEEEQYGDEEELTCTCKGSKIGKAILKGTEFKIFVTLATAS